MQISSSRDWCQVKDYFYKTGQVPEQTELDPTILQMWHKAKAAGLSPFTPVPASTQQPLTTDDIRLSETVFPILKDIWALFKHQNICTFFLNTQFKIIAEYQNPDPHSPYHFLKQGQVLDIAQFGSIAPSCSILSQMPIIMMGHQHYLNEFSDFYCASVPVFNGQGKILGALDITSYREQLASNWLRHLLYQGYVVENEIIKKNMPAQHQLLYFQHSEDLLKTAYTGMIEIDATGQIQKANQMALTLLNTSIDQLLYKPISNYFSSISTLASLEQQTQFIRSQDEALFYARLYTPQMTKKTSHLFSTSTPDFKDIAKLSKILHSDVPILITGATGSGKDHLARQIHEFAAKDQAFISINCAAIPEHLLESELFGYEAGAFTGASAKGKRGLIELAHQGILFLDEIGDLPKHLQAKLLRVLQDQFFYRVGGHKPIQSQFKLISATHQDLLAMIDNHDFRSDLYYRICGYQIELPQLKDRPDKIDIFKTLLANAKIYSWSVNVQEQFERYDWPGNIRELAHVIQLSAALIAHDSLEHAHLEHLHLPQQRKVTPQSYLANKPQTSLNQMTKQLVLDILQQEKGNISQAAKRLNISRTTLYKYLQ